MGGKSFKDMNTEEQGSGLGVWNQVDPFGVGDARKFQHYGGDESTYKALTPEERAQYKGFLTEGSDNYLGSLPTNRGQQDTLRQWIAGTKSHHPGMSAADATISPLLRNMGLGGSIPTPGGAGAAGAGPASDTSLYAQLLGQSGGDAAKFQVEQRLDPTWNHKEEMLRTRLLNQGLDPSSEASQNTMGQFGRDRNDAYSATINQGQGQRFSNALNAWMADTNAKMGFANQQQSNTADIASELARLGPTAVKALRGFLPSGAEGGGTVTYDPMGNPMVNGSYVTSSPAEWDLPEFPT